MIYAENILICIAVPLLISLLFIRGGNRRFIASFLVGMGVCLLSAYISGYINFAAELGADETSVFISPIVEELMKLLPVLFMLFLFEPSDNTLLSVAIGVGTGFATFENCCHILTAGAESLPYILVRGMAVGVMHIVSMMAVTMGLLIARQWKALSIPGITGALSLPVTFHALYNLLVSERGVSSHIGYALPLLTAVILVIPYRKVFKSKI